MIEVPNNLESIHGIISQNNQEKMVKYIKLGTNKALMGKKMGGGGGGDMGLCH